MDALGLLRGIPSLPVAGLDARANHHHRPPAQVAVVGPRSYMSPRPLRRLWPRGDGGSVVGRREEEKDGDLVAGVEERDTPAMTGGRRRGNWVLNILQVRSLWAKEDGEGGGVDGGGGEAEEEEEEGVRCVGCGGDGGDGSEEGCEMDGGAAVDRESFSRMLRRVSLVEAELYAKMSYLSHLAYTIPRIKPASLLKCHGLHFITSSLEKKAKLSAEKEHMPTQDQEQEEKTGDAEEGEKPKESSNGINALAAYRIAASAASYLQSQTKGILPFGSAKAAMGKHSSEGGNKSYSQYEIESSEVASFVAATNSITAVVAGKEEMKQAVVKDLNSLQSSPCEWFICDEVSSGARYFIIQGSESLASWQANLLFEPIQFEGLDVLVHRGIYEAAKGIYKQMLPEIQAHLKSHGNSATLRFTGHSLGGSLAVLVNLMLLIRGDAPASSLLPVITFGAPSVMCGGDYLLQKLGLPKKHVQSITMHRDIVPRAFSCNYPDHVVNILMAVNGNFRNHPCLNKQKHLYGPMGKLLILQPEEKFSPHHHLLPPGSGLYLLGHSLDGSNDSVSLLQAAQHAFLNSPHPLEILSDRAAYSSKGTVYRDHDMNAYLRSMWGVFRQELKLIRKAKRDHWCLLWWPLVSSQGIHSDVITSQHPGPHKFGFAGMLHGGKETLKRFGRMVLSQHLHMFIVLLFPARLLLLGTLSFVNFR